MDNSSDNKRIAKNAFLLYLRMLLQVCLSLYTSRIVLAVLGFEDYGLNNVIGGIIAMFGFFNFAMTNATSRFITYALGEDNLRKLKEVFTTASFIHFFIAFIIIVIGETVGLWYLENKLVIPEGRHFAAECLYQLSILATVVSIISVPYNSCIVAHEKMSAFAYISIMDTILKLLIVFVIKYSPFDKLIFLGVLTFLVGIIDRIIYGVYCSKHFEESRLIKFWDWKLCKKMLSFAGWSMFGNFSFLFYSQGLSLILNFFCGTTVNAARGIAISIENITRQLASNVQTAINPQIIKNYAKEDKRRMFDLMYASTRYCFYLLLFVSLPIIFETPYILSLWLDEYPEHTVNFVRLTLLIIMFDSFVNPLFTANVATGRIRNYQVGFCIVTFLFMPITYFSISLSGIPEYVYYSAIVMNIIALIVRLYVTKINIDFNIREYCNSVVLKIILVSVLSLVFPLLIVHFMQEGTTRFFIVTVTTALSVLMVVYLFGINSSERIFVNNKIKNIFNYENS